MAALWRDRGVLWLLSVLASAGIAGALAMWRWSVEYDTLAPLCRTASRECLNAVEQDATLVALAAFAVLFVFALIISTALVFRVQFFGGRTQTSGQPARIFSSSPSTHSEHPAPEVAETPLEPAKLRSGAVVTEVEDSGTAWTRPASG